MLMPVLRKFEKYYTMTKSFAHRCEMFEIRPFKDFKTQEYRSVKIYRKSELNKQRIQYLKREIDNCKDLDHPNLIKIYDVIEDDTKIYLIIDTIRG